MKRIIKLLLALHRICSKTAGDKNPSFPEILNRDLKIGDKVKKQVFIGYTESGKKRIQGEDFFYGKIIFIENGYASVRYIHQKIPEREMLSDLIYVCENEWKFIKDN